MQTTKILSSFLKRTVKFNNPQQIITRHSRRSLNRSPKVVLTEQEAQKHGFESPFKSRHSLVVEEKREEKDLDPAREVNLGTKVNEEIIQNTKKINLPAYEKLEEDDKRFTSIMMIAKSKKSREKKNKILLEGRRLIQDGIEAGLSFDAIYFSREDVLAGIDFEKIEGTKLYKVFYKTMKVWSDLTTCPGIMGICKKPEAGKMRYFGEKPLPLTVICDNIREPGNLGAVLRCIAAAGCEKAVTTKGCVDVWEPKVLRGGSGAHFRLPIYGSVDWQFVRNYLPNSFEVILADNKEVETDFPVLAKKEKKKKTRKEVNEDDENDDEFELVEKTDDGLLKHLSYKSSDKLEQLKSTPLPVQRYSEIKFATTSHVVLVIGGETEGLSGGAYKLAHDFNGYKTTIPLANNIESLNVSAACSVLLFEIRRQLNKV